ncbi:MAG: division/cell wall cluster transcriptional repressor MraZ [candidate division Zixibacteria bacterium]|nr:division/cell wall cluster transcriptional repressor MraZ [candidate division Zixibacteria bacterium]
MTFLNNSYRYSVDHKGRVNLPAKYRKTNSSTLYDTYMVTVGLEGCLAVYPMDEWERLLERLRNLHSNKKDIRRYQRFLFSNASESKLDKQGRIIVPQELLEYAKIKKEILIVRMIDRLELWNPDTFQDYVKSGDKTIEEIVEEIEG